MKNSATDGSENDLNKEFLTLGTVFTNGRVTVAPQLNPATVVVELCVLTDCGWEPLADLDAQDLDTVDRLIDFNPTFPWPRRLAELVNCKRSSVP